MQKRKIRLGLTRRLPSTSSVGGRRKRKTATRRKRAGGQRLRNAHVLHKWINGRAKPWMVKGRGKFWKGLWNGIKKTGKFLGNIGGPILDAMGMPEFGVPLSIAANLL